VGDNRTLKGASVGVGPVCLIGGTEGTTTVPPTTGTTVAFPFNGIKGLYFSGVAVDVSSPVFLLQAEISRASSSQR